MNRIKKYFKLREVVNSYDNVEDLKDYIRHREIGVENMNNLKEYEIFKRKATERLRSEKTALRLATKRLGKMVA